MKILVILLTAMCSLGMAQDRPEIKKLDPIKFEREGSGGMSGTFPGFTEVDSQKLEKAIELAVSLVRELNIGSDQDLSMIWNLENEIQSTKYIQIKNKTAAKANRFAGDYNWSGLLVASTKPFPGSATYIYPGFLDNNNIDATQVAQMVIEEALHRSLPGPINRYEKIVKSITRIISTNSGNKSKALKNYFNKIKNVRFPWQVKFIVRGFDRYHAPVIKEKLQNTKRIVETNGEARIVVEFIQKSNVSGGHVVFRDTYNNTQKTLPVNFMWKRLDLVSPHEYQPVINFILTELRDIEFMQSL